MQRKDTEIQRKDFEIQRKDFEIQRKDFEIQTKAGEIQRKAGEIQQKDTEIQMKVNQMQERDTEIQRNYREIQHLTATLHDKDVMLEALRLNMSKLQITDYHSLPKKVSKQCIIIHYHYLCVQVNKSSNDFWNNLKLTWQQCTNLPSKYFATSVAELDGKVYVTVKDSKSAHAEPLMYDSNKDQWSTLSALPYVKFTLVAIADRKQLLAIGGVVNNNGVIEISNKVFLWDEENRRWTTPYPNMPTARYFCSSISHGSTVIVAGGVSCLGPWTMTRAVEVLRIKKNSLFTKSHWSVVEQLPLVVYNAIPLIVNDELYIAVGCDKKIGATTCIIVTASLPELLQSSNKSTIQVWHKLTDMPYSSLSINLYQGRLITFGGDHRVEQPNKDEPVW